MIELTFIGKTIGRRLKGKKCMFVDMISCETPSEIKMKEVSQDVNGTGNHIRRDKVLNNSTPTNNDKVFSV